mmetsp:Transcript_33656/g.51944  ORF Transcript_33656/g.51944 Transcript_33656/m.51944 type:complete len:137 (+) Transcript_33656:1366-1776(+)
MIPDFKPQPSNRNFECVATPSIPLEDRVVDLSNESIRRESIRQLNDVQLMVDNNFDDEFLQSVRQSTVKKEVETGTVGFWDNCYGLQSAPEEEKKEEEEELPMWYKYTLMGNQSGQQPPRGRDFTFVGSSDAGPTN